MEGGGGEMRAGEEGWLWDIGGRSGADFSRAMVMTRGMTEVVVWSEEGASVKTDS